jgi:hypothetical protein
MHAFIVGTSFIIGYMFVKSCCRRRYNSNIAECPWEREESNSIYPYTQFIARTEILQFFSLDKNFNRLKTILDVNNGVLQRTIKTLENNYEIRRKYEILQEMYDGNKFSYESHNPVVYEIRGQMFKTSLAQLNFIKWFIEEDYFLYVE